ncbi:CPXCG motif-containing cysteine-rich protein [Kangiella taiwanensis]|uniref:CPXCG motif-containing cysteine-rich protein n=1 Tax=Kangiella taiwanensis TaxID=1079179 RepID=A0ABP8HPV7_9GAMM|nr:CPXCG motif-containing cysteine-rich protein [Kangiella taiwanensis]
MLQQIEKDISCPYCGEVITVLIDNSVPHQEYIEDCQVCCRPIEFVVSVTGDDVDLVVRSDF